MGGSLWIKRRKNLGEFVAIISVLFIVFMWVKNDIVSIYSTIPKEQIIPLIATTIVVILFKVGGIALVIFLIKWIIGKISKRDK